MSTLDAEHRHSLDLACAWWPTAAAAKVAPLQAVRDTVAALAAGTPVPAPAAAHMAQALRMFLDGKGNDITRNLGLSPRPGGRWDAPIVRERRRRRDALIVELFDAMPGSRPSRAKHVADLLARRPAPEVTEADVARACEQLMREFGDTLPTSDRQILRVVRAHKP